MWRTRSCGAYSLLEITGLRKSYGGTTALDGLSVSFAAGQMVGIVGRSGAGKSTLLCCVNRLIEPDSGGIVYGGRDILALRGSALHDWRAECGMIFQQFHLVDRLDAVTNVMLGAVRRRRTLPLLFKIFPEADRRRAMELLERLDLAAQSGQMVRTLSGGQQQRVAIARALMQGVKILLADEPVASLDPENARVVMEALRGLQREDGVTVLCNLHQLELARTYCDRVIGLAKGKVIFDGRPAEMTERIYTAAV